MAKEFNEEATEEWRITSWHNMSVEGLEALILRGADFNVKDGGGNIALNTMSWHGQKDKVEMLLRHGADSSLEDKDYDTALDCAGKRGHTEIVKILEEYEARGGASAGKGFVYSGSHSSTSSTSAPREFNEEATKEWEDTHWRGAGVEELEALILKGANFNTQASSGNTALINNAFWGKKDKVEMLLRHGADSTLKGENNDTALDCARKKGHTEIVKILEEYEARGGAGADKESVYSGSHGSASSTSAPREFDEEATEEWRSTHWHNKSVEELEALILRGADFNVKDGCGDIALNVVSWNGQKDKVEMLLRHGADSSLRDKDDDTALDCARKRGYKKIVKILEEYEARGGASAGKGFVYSGSHDSASSTSATREFDEEATEEWKDTRWHSMGVEGLEALILRGADFNVKNGDGDIALNTVCWFGYKDKVEMLLKHGADSSLRDKDNDTALDCARKQEQTEIVKILKEYEARGGARSVHRGGSSSYHAKTYRSSGYTSKSSSKSSSDATSRRKKYGIEIEEAPMSVKEQIDFYVSNGMSFMLHGPSGVGKTARVEAIDPDLTAVPLWNGVLPEDVVGKVRYPSGGEALATEENLDSGIWVKPDWYNELCKKCEAEPDKKHVLFIDEITNARPTTQSLIFHITLKKSISPSKGKIPDNAVVVLAGNSIDESGAAYNMPEPLFRRMCGHIHLKADIKDWLEWASENNTKHPEDKERLNIHPIVSSFVATYGDKAFYTSYDEDEPKEWALDPRAWEQVSDIVYNNNGVIRRELLENKMGKELATNFIAYAKNPPLSKEEILAEEYSSSDIPQGQDQKLALALSLKNATDKEVGKIRQFISNNLGQENRAVFDSHWAGKDDERALYLASLDRKGR